MRPLISIVLILMVPMLRAEWVGMQFSVSAPCGKPIESATITLETAEKRMLPYAAKKFKTLKCQTHFCAWRWCVCFERDLPGIYAYRLCSGNEQVV